MPLIEWKDELSVDINTIDKQHKGLIALINELHEGMRVGKGQDMLGETLTKLVEYTKMHFATEEKFFETYKYPGYVAHKSEHDKLTGQVLDFKSKFDNKQAVVTVELMSFLKDWLRKHIVGTDRKYSQFLIQKGVT